mmetsp:Transcript_25100/g.99848  ORF Transcript_25100/g.99848 Transcript_25100/m.99848 type:complete len:211 (-) Transcript_25100:43-675(-)
MMMMLPRGRRRSSAAPRPRRPRRPRRARPRGRRAAPPRRPRRRPRRASEFRAIFGGPGGPAASGGASSRRLAGGAIQLFGGAPPPHWWPLWRTTRAASCRGVPRVGTLLGSQRPLLCVSFSPPPPPWCTIRCLPRSTNTQPPHSLRRSRRTSRPVLIWSWCARAVRVLLRRSRTPSPRHGATLCQGCRRHSSAPRGDVLFVGSTRMRFTV